MDSRVMGKHDGCGGVVLYVSTRAWGKHQCLRCGADSMKGQHLTFSTLSTSEAWEFQCYGNLTADVWAALEPQSKLTGWSMLLMSMMSDVQEMILRGMDEDARQLLNRCKLVLAEKVAKRDEKGRMA